MRVFQCRPGQAKREPGSITTDVGIAPRLGPLFVSQLAFVVMGPRFRGDDNYNYSDSITK
jgi:hypothetical protein